MHKKLLKLVSLRLSVDERLKYLSVLMRLRFGWAFDQNFDQQIFIACKLRHCDLRRISANRHFLISDASEVPLCVFFAFYTSTIATRLLLASPISSLQAPKKLRTAQRVYSSGFRVQVQVYLPSLSLFE